MKFGSTIKQGLYAEWQQYYIDYSGLKKFLKKRQAVHEDRKESATWDDTDEAEFIKQLQDELKKVSKFQEDKVGELHGQIALYSSEVQRLVDRKNKVSRGGSAAGRAGSDSTATAGGVESEGTARLGDDEESLHRDDREYDDDEDDDEEDDEEEIERRFVELEEDLEVLIADVYDLGKFTHLNYTGFIKIVKKHDKRTGWELKGDFVRQYLEKRPFYKENYDALIVQLSKLYNLVRTRGNPVQGDSAAGGGQSAFVRQTTKYWVHPDNYVNLKLAVLKHLPVLVFDANKKYEAEDAAISSIYFDNADLDLYLGRLEKSEGAEAIRLRWYGGMGVKQIFVERKTHREDWTGEKSVKARFPIKEELVNDYLSGKITMDATFNELRKKGKKSDKEIDSMIRLAKEVQASILNQKLEPVVRTFYNRTAFQLPGDARVRISFDTNLTLVREDNWDNGKRSGNNWRRMDIGIDWPFEQLPKEDLELFPYGVLEVKLQTQMGQEPPEWVRELVSSHLVEAVPKFSKFIHGCATLLPNRVDLVPFWLPQMETDIRKPVSTKKAALIERPTASNSHTPTTTSDTDPHAAGYTEPLSEDEDEGPEAADDDDSDDDRRGKGDPFSKVTNDEAGVAGLPAEVQAQVEDARAFREKNRLSQQHLSPNSSTARNGKAAVLPLNEDSAASNNASTSEARTSGARATADLAKLTPRNLKKMLAAKYEAEGQPNGESASTTDGAVSGGANGQTGPGQSGISSSGEPNSTEYVNSFTYNGKRIAVPIRVEPKVNFALERTLLAWVEFSVLISAIGVGLLNFTNKHDHVGFAAAVTFTVLALIAIAYSGAMFLYRALAIRARRAINYHDRYGPTALVVALIAATVINFALKIADGF